MVGASDVYALLLHCARGRGALRPSIGRELYMEGVSSVLTWAMLLMQDEAFGSVKEACF